MSGYPIRVRLRSRDDFDRRITGQLLTNLRAIAGEVKVAPVDPDPMRNPLAIGIRLGHMDQLEAVRDAISSWLLEPEWPEGMDRVATVHVPGGGLLMFVYLDPESATVRVPELSVEGLV